MCGIIGVIGTGEVAPRLLDGLRRLEYRGYDSAGIATLLNGGIARRRAQGKLVNLAGVLDGSPVGGEVGIGHTRWATHGVPSADNAHPHATERVAVVHNGIIENFQALRDELEAQGHIFVTQTDTEVIPYLITQKLVEGSSPQDAVQVALGRLEGAFALAVLFAGENDLLICARRGAPLAVGHGEGEMYLASDAVALAPLTRQITYLEEGDWAELSRAGAIVHDASGAVVERPVSEAHVVDEEVDKGNFEHFMLKEIYEQPAVMGDTLNAYYDSAGHAIRLPPQANFSVAGLTRLTLVACGTSFYAGLVAKYWLEQVARLPVEIDVASEFRYRDAPLPKGGAALMISQSGETADTLAALRFVKEQGQRVIAVVNVPESSMARIATCCCRPMRARRSGLLRPRRSPASSSPWPASPSPRGASGARLTVPRRSVSRRPWPRFPRGRRKCSTTASASGHSRRASRMLGGSFISAGVMSIPWRSKARSSLRSYPTCTPRALRLAS